MARNPDCGGCTIEDDFMANIHHLVETVEQGLNEKVPQQQPEVITLADDSKQEVITIDSDTDEAEAKDMPVGYMYPWARANAFFERGTMDLDAHKNNGHSEQEQEQEVDYCRLCYR